MSNLILAIDPSLNSTGICVLPVESKTPIAYQCIRPPVGDPRRLSYIYSMYRTLFKTYGSDLVYIAYEKQMNQMRYGYQSGTILELAENIGVLKLSILHCIDNFRTKIVRVQPDVIKKYATGNSKATKDDMIAAVNGNHIKSMRHSVPEDAVNDVADAYHLAHLVQSRISDGTIEELIYEGW